MYDYATSEGVTSHRVVTLMGTVYWISVTVGRLLSVRLVGHTHSLSPRCPAPKGSPCLVVQLDWVGRGCRRVSLGRGPGRNVFGLRQRSQGQCHSGFWSRGLLAHLSNFQHAAHHWQCDPVKVMSMCGTLLLELTLLPLGPMP